MYIYIYTYYVHICVYIVIRISNCTTDEQSKPRFLSAIMHTSTRTNKFIWIFLHERVVARLSDERERERGIDSMRRDFTRLFNIVPRTRLIMFFFFLPFLFFFFLLINLSEETYMYSIAYDDVVRAFTRQVWFLYL